MSDQAEKLRNMVNDLNNVQKKSQFLNAEYPTTVQKKRRCMVITVTSGKGGVGKTNISVNLALNLSQMGYRVIIFDADFGLSNIDILLGLTPKYNLLDVINNKKTITEILSDGPMGIKFISGGSGVEKMLHLSDSEFEDVLSKISLLDALADIIIVDTGAGIAENVIRFVLAADQVILVTTPEPTSIMDAYALIKVISYRDNTKNIGFIVNRVDNEKEALSVRNRIITVSEKFLNLKLNCLGYIFFDNNVIRAVKQQEPFVMLYPKSSVTKQIGEIACRTIDVPLPEQEVTGIRGFFGKLLRAKKGGGDKI